MDTLLPNQKRLTTALFLFGALILGVDPLIWLVRTWLDPSYASSGAWFAIIPAALFIWSVSSEKKSDHKQNLKFPILLLVTSAAVRAAGQLLAVNMIGAVTLIIDVYAISCIFTLNHRVRAVSPFWISVLFAFSLPIERVLQRVFGYGLQNISADAACTVLDGLYDNVTCQGIRILINAKDVMVDLPCSGARAFILLLFLFCIVCAVGRYSLSDILKGLAITIIAAFISNVIRICVLSSGVGYPELAGSLHVMSQPAHDMIGLLTLSLGGIPVILWAKRCSPCNDNHKLPWKVIKDAWWLGITPFKTTTFGFAFLLSAISVTTLPKKAFDVTSRDLPLALPQAINGKVAMPIPLLEQEESYFTQYGGSAKKALYGEQSLLMVKTSAPLRHLHTPDDCLRGLGYDVDYIGIDYQHVPTAIYKATHESGKNFRVAVSFASADFKHITTNVSHAVWTWMQNPDQSWIAIQRISVWDDPAALSFDQDVFVALNHNPSTLKLAYLKESSDD